MHGSISNTNILDFYYRSPFNDSTGNLTLKSLMPDYAGYYGNDSDGKLS